MGPDAVSVHHGNNAAIEGDDHILGKTAHRDARSRFTSEVESLARVRNSRSNHSHITVVGDAVVIVAYTSGVGEEGVEFNVTLSSVSEVKLHSQDRRGSLSNRGRAEHSVIVSNSVRSRSHRSLTHVTRRHVVTEDLHSVDVGHNTVRVQELSVNSSHSRHAGERLAEVHGTRRLLRGRASNERGPRTIGEVGSVPSTLEGAGELPFGILVDGRIEREIHRFFSLIGHNVLQNSVVVDVLDLNPSTIGPGIITVLHGKRIYAVRSSRQAHLKGTFLIIDQIG